jgi:hypothetical protein
MPKMTAQELRWQAESDADTMARYQMIMDDPARKKRAVSAAMKQAADLNKRATAMNRAAGVSSKKRK